jgi:hypothetical protein
LGVLLVLACATAFLVVSLNSGDRRSVLALARPVSVGHVLAAQDLQQVSITVDAGVSVVDAGQASGVVGKTMSTSLPAGALLTLDAVSGAGMPAEGEAIAALSLKAGQFPPEVAPGTHVSVVQVPGSAGATVSSNPSPSDSAPESTSESATGFTTDATTVGPAVVASVTTPPDEQTTVVSVQLPEDAARQVAAVPAGQLSIVMLSGGR